MGIPIVCIARGVPNDNFVYVSANNVEGGAKATNFLIKRGHKRIAHIMGPKTLHISQSRYEGYKNALKKNKIQLDPQLVKEVLYDVEKFDNGLYERKDLKWARHNYVNHLIMNWAKSCFVSRSVCRL